MAMEVLADELAFSIAVNKIDHYVTLLIEYADMYSDYMNGITQSAINDDAISSRLRQLADAVKEHTDALKGLSGSLKTIIGAYMDELEAADTFDYPEDVLTKIRSILSPFGI